MQERWLSVDEVAAHRALADAAALIGWNVTCEAKVQSDSLQGAETAANNLVRQPVAPDHRTDLGRSYRGVAEYYE
jgi:hypothetical protein